MKKDSAIAVVVLLTIGLVFAFTPDVRAQQKKVTDLEGVQFNTGASLADNMKAFVGKDVFIHLRSGKTFQGYLKSVGNGLVQLEKLAGREFYDALIRIEDISAVEAKFRDMK
jgi:hypothetical protein